MLIYEHFDGSENIRSRVKIPVRKWKYSCPRAKKYFFNFGVEILNFQEIQVHTLREGGCKIKGGGGGVGRACEVLLRWGLGYFCWGRWFSFCVGRSACLKGVRGDEVGWAVELFVLGCFANWGVFFLGRNAVAKLWEMKCPGSTPLEEEWFSSWAVLLSFPWQ